METKTLISPRFFIETISVATFLWLAGIGAQTPAQGQNLIFTANFNNTISEYVDSGAELNASFIVDSSGPACLADSGNNLFVGDGHGVGEYTTFGSANNASLISDANGVQCLAITGTNLFVANYFGSDSIAEYSTSGATINAAFLTGLWQANTGGFPYGLAISGTNLFVAYEGNGKEQVGEYTTSGATVNAALISGFVPGGIAISGTNLFVVNINSGTIGEYTTSGSVINASLITGLSSPQGLAISGSDLFVYNSSNGSIGEYTTSGATVNASLITGLNIQGFAVVPIPPPPVSITTVSNQPVVIWPSLPVGAVVQMTTNLSSSNWTTVTGIPYSGLLITNASSPAFFRVLAQP